MRLTPVSLKRTLCAAHRVRNVSLCVESSPTRSERPRSYGSRPASDRRVATTSFASVSDVRRRSRHRVQGALDVRPHPLLRRAPACRRRRVRGARKVEEMRPLGIIELQRTRQRLQDAFRDSVHVPPLEAGVVVDADAGQDRHLLAAEPWDAAAIAVDVQGRLVWPSCSAPATSAPKPSLTPTWWNRDPGGAADLLRQRHDRRRPRPSAGVHQRGLPDVLEGTHRARPDLRPGRVLGRGARRVPDDHEREAIKVLIEL